MAHLRMICPGCGTFTPSSQREPSGRHPGHTVRGIRFDAASRLLIKEQQRVHSPIKKDTCATYLLPPLGLRHTGRMNDKLLALRLFVRVARAGSFSAAARELDLSQPSVSRIIAALEEEVGAALVTRTTRAVTLTDVGNDYLTRVEAIMASLEEADHAARGSRELRGALRIATPASFGVREIVPLMPDFLAR